MYYKLLLKGGDVVKTPYNANTMRNELSGDKIMITLRDMGLKSKVLIAACQESGVKMNKERASRIINGMTIIKYEEMEVISKILNKTVDELYVKLGSHLADMTCPLLTMAYGQKTICWSYACNLWDRKAQWCRFKGLKP